MAVNITSNLLGPQAPTVVDIPYDPSAVNAERDLHGGWKLLRGSLVVVQSFAASSSFAIVGADMEAFPNGECCAACSAFLCMPPFQVGTAATHAHGHSCIVPDDDRDVWQQRQILC